MGAQVPKVCCCHLTSLLSRSRPKMELPVGIRMLGMCTVLLGATLPLTACTSNQSLTTQFLQDHDTISGTPTRKLSGSCRPRPVFLIHGLGSRSQHNDNLAAWIRGAHPGTKTIHIPLFQDAFSLSPLPSQVTGVAAYIRGSIFLNPDAFSSGYDFVCH